MGHPCRWEVRLRLNVRQIMDTRENIEDYEDGVARLVRAGNDVSKPMFIRFEVIELRKKGANAVAEAAREASYDSEVLKSKRQWICACSKTMMMTAEAIYDAEAELNAIAEPHGTGVGGWSIHADAAEERKAREAAESSEPSAPEIVIDPEDTVVTNKKALAYSFLKEMYEDDYFPGDLVDIGKSIVLKLCHDIEEARPADDAAVLVLTHGATKRFNDLAAVFAAQGGEFETAARDCIATDFEFVVETYGFDLDPEEIIAPREW